jgi:hypothetical protein
LLVHLGLPANREALALARKGFEEALRVDAASTDAKQGLLVVEIAQAHRDVALALAAELAAAAPATLKKVEDVLTAFPTLAEKLRAMGLQFSDGKLVPSGSAGAGAH